jgi:hypothetical protein
MLQPANRPEGRSFSTLSTPVLHRPNPWRTHSCVQRSHSCERVFVTASNERMPRQSVKIRKAAFLAS